MQLLRFSLIILIFVFGGCSGPSDAEMGQATARSVEQNKALIRQVLALIDERKLDEAFELYALDYQYHGPGGRN